MAAGGPVAPLTDRRPRSTATTGSDFQLVLLPPPPLPLHHQTPRLIKKKEQQEGASWPPLYQKVIRGQSEVTPVDRRPGATVLGDSYSPADVKAGLNTWFN